MKMLLTVLGLLLLSAVMLHARPRMSSKPTGPPLTQVATLKTKQGSSALGQVDTVYYGGTAWAPDSNRWEAVREGVWTFDSGVGSSINMGQNLNKPVGYHQTMEGWRGVDLSLPALAYFRRSALCPISGSHSLWAGVSEYEAATLCYASGQGYGNSWEGARSKVFNYPGTGTVLFSFDYAVEAEPSFDYLYVVVDTTGLNRSWRDAITLRTFTGLTSGTESLVLTRGVTLPAAGGPFSIKFVVTSDGSYSDQDGLFPSTCGHTAIDNVSLSGAVNSVDDFEINEDGWLLNSPTTALGDFTRLASLASLPPPLTGPCSLQDSVLVFHDTMLQHPSQDNFAMSPWIDLKRGGDLNREGRLLLYDVYANLPPPNCPPVYVVIKARWYPSICPTSGLVVVTDFRDAASATIYGGEPFCTSSGDPWVHDLTDLIEPGAEQVQIAIWVTNIFLCTFSSPQGRGDTSPWFDNVRFGVYGSATSGVIEGSASKTHLGLARPNPVRTFTIIDYTMPHSGLVMIEIIDVTGRLVRRVVNGHKHFGEHSVLWDGLNAFGQRVAPGVYFYRMVTDKHDETKKLVVIR